MKKIKISNYIFYNQIIRMRIITVKNLILLISFLITISFAAFDYDIRTEFKDNGIIADSRILTHLYYLDPLYMDFDSASEQYTGYSMFNFGKYELSVSKFEELMYYENPPVASDWNAFWYGLSYLRYGQLPDLYERIESFDSPWAKFWQALSLFSRNEYDQTIEILREVVNDPDIQNILRLESEYFIALSYIEKNQIGRAEDVFDEIVEKFPNNILSGEILFRQAQIEFNRQNYVGALDKLSECEIFYKKSARKESHWWIEDMYYLFASSNLLLQRYNNAIAWSRELLDNYPESRFREQAEYITMLGVLHDDGETDLAQMDNISSEFKWDLLSRIGYERYSAGHFNEAVIFFENSLNYAETEYQFLQSYFYIGEAYYEQNSFDDAIKFYNKNNRFDDPFYRESQWGTGWALIQLKDYENARNAFMEVVKDFADSVSKLAEYKIAESFYFEKDYPKAIEKFEEYLLKYNDYQSGRILDYLVFSYKKENKTFALDDRVEEFIVKYRSKSLIENYGVNLLNTFIKNEDFDRIDTIMSILIDSDVNQAILDTFAILNEEAKFLSGQYKTEFEYIDSILSKNPNNHLISHVIFGKSNKLLRDGKYDQAVLLFDLIDKNTITDSLWGVIKYEQALCFYEMNDSLNLFKNIDILVGEFPSHPYASKSMLLHAKWYQENDNRLLAISILERLQELFSDSPEVPLATLEIASIYEKDELYNESRAVLSGIIMSDDSLSKKYLSTALNSIMDSYVKEGIYQAGIDFYSRWSDKISKGERRDFDKNYALAHFKLGNYFTADSILTEITMMNNNSNVATQSDLYYIWSDILRSTKNYDRACSVLSIIVGEEENDSLVRRAREELLEIQSMISRRNEKNQEEK